MKVISALFISTALILLFSSVLGAYSTDRIQAQEESQTGAEVQGADNTAEVRLRFSFAEPESTAGYGCYALQGDRTSIIPQMPELHTYNIPGEPMVPFKTAKMLVPYGQEVQDIEVIRSAKVRLGEFFIQPGQQPYPLNDGMGIEPTIPDATIYNSTEPYPRKPFVKVSTQWKQGYQILILNLHPVEYIPKSGELGYFPAIEVVVTTKQAEAVQDDMFRGLSGDRTSIASMVDNPAEMATYDAATNAFQLQDPYDYLIITNADLLNNTPAPNFLTLKNHKDAKGVATQIATVEDIYTSTSGIDAQDKIRNYIIQEYNGHGISYVLLGGDADGADVGGESGDNIVPVRGLWAASDECDPPNIPADLYYACLDGNYNSNSNDIYGEPTDGPGGEDVDLYAEVYVGRAPVDSYTEVQNFVNKTIAYETASGDPYLNNVWMVGELLWTNPDTWGGTYKSEIKNGSSSCGYTTEGIPGTCCKSTLYDYESSWAAADIAAVINSNVHIINHLGHCSPNWLMRMTVTDVDALTNDKYFFGYSQGCYPGAFDNRSFEPGCGYLDYDCTAEHMVTQPHGAFGFVANSRYGWGVKGSTCGASQYYDREFWDAVYGEGIANVGRANQDSKEDNIGFVGGSIMRFCYYELNLLGDPETPLWPCSGCSAPEISVVPPTLNVTLPLDTTWEGTLQIYNDGGGILTYNIPDDGCAWLDENPKSGSIADGDSDLITVSIDTAGLAPGSYTCNIAINNNDADENPVIVSVNLTAGDTGINLTVINREGVPASDAYVYAYSDISDFPIWEGSTDGSGQAFLNVPDGTYILMISSWNDNFCIVKPDVTAPCSLVVDAATETVPVAITASKLDGSPLGGANVEVSIRKFWPRSIGNTDDSGQTTIYLTPCTYRDIFLWDWNDLYYLYHSGPTIPDAASALPFNSAAMPTGQCALNVVDFADAGFVPWLREPDYTGCAPVFRVIDGSIVTLSEGSYYIWCELAKTDDDETINFAVDVGETGEVNITDGSSTTLHIGGDFSAAVTPEQLSCDPGDLVNLDCLIADSFENRLWSSYVYHSTAAELPQKQDGPVIRREEGEDYQSAMKALHDSLDWEGNAPTLTITAPDDTVFLEVQGFDLFYDYAFELPPDAPTGIWTATLSFDTGPHQGVIEGTTPINVGVVPDIRVDPTVLNITLPPDTVRDYTLTIANDGQGALTYSISEQMCTCAQAASPTRSITEIPLELSGLSGTDMVESELLNSGHQNSSNYVGNGSPLIAVAACYWGNCNETDALHQTLTEFGLSYLDVASVAEAEAAGANVLIGYYGCDQLDPTAIGNYITAGNGYIQIGDWVPWFANAYESIGNSNSVTVTINDAVHPITAGLPDSWISRGFWSYGYGDDFVGWVTDTSKPNIGSLQATGYTSHDRVISAAISGAGRAVYLGFNIYGDLASSNDKLLFHNALEWVSAADCLWLDVTPKTGTVEPGNYAEVTVTIDTTGLAPAIGGILAAAGLALSQPKLEPKNQQQPIGSSLEKTTEVVPVMSSQNPMAPATVALFEDSLPWGTASTEDILTAYGIPYDVYTSSQMGSVDLSPYEKVITASVQGDAFWNALEANRTWFESYVSNGGVMEMHLAPYSGSNSPGKVYPGGFVYCDSPDNLTSITEPSHPVVNTPNTITNEELDGWNYSSHGYFDTITAGSHTVLTQTESGEPVWVEVAFGSGCMFATTQTVEWGYYFGYSAFLENMALHTCSGDNYYTCNIVISSNDPDENPTAVPVNLIVQSGVPGDANGDGEINVLDMTKVAREILLLDAETYGADCNQDGSVNVLDMTCIAKKILELD